MATDKQTIQFEVERLGAAGYFRQLIWGFGTLFGLALLWVLEIVRNNYFRLLDRLNVRPRRRRSVSAFPPGRPRKRRTV